MRSNCCVEREKVQYLDIFCLGGKVFYQIFQVFHCFILAEVKGCRMIDILWLPCFYGCRGEFCLNL